ncbi:MAG: hypothetical protein INR73_26535 [Williamsia sp.]|nr:hypothetical protein [Williamsia sp.]
MNEWKDLFVATAGAAAALTGLIFVGISINLNKILAHQALPTRASVSLALLMSILLFSVVLLVPVKSLSDTGWLVLTFGLIVWILVTRGDVKIYRKTRQEYKRLFLYNVLLDQVSVLPYIVGGFLLLSGSEAGAYCIVTAFVFSFIKAVSDAWVLVIEILR